MAGGTQSIGALIVELRANSAQFTAEMDKTRGSLQAVGGHAALSSRQLARFAAIGAEQLVPGLQGSRQAVEGLVQALAGARGAFALLGPVTAVVATAFAGFALGNIIRNFQDLQREGHGYVESLKLAVGMTKSYEQATKDAAEAQKKFSAEMQAARVVRQGLNKELATLLDQQEQGIKIAEDERRAKIQTLPLDQRAAEQAKSEFITTLQLRKLREENEQKLIDQIQKDRDLQVKAWADETKALVDQLNFRLKARQDFEAQLGKGGLPGTGLVQGLAAARDFSGQIGKEALDIAGLERLGRLSSRDATTERENVRARALAQAEALRQQFAEFPPVLEAIDRAVNSIEFGNFGKEMDQARLNAGELLATDEQLTTGLGQIASQLIKTVPSSEAAAKATQELTRAYLDLANGIYAAVNAKIAFDQVTVE
jgi:hypothetical protein